MEQFKNEAIMKKCILLVRVSTEKQTYDEQMQQLHDKAIKDGYTDETIIPIAEKESGIKLKEEERIGLNRMKQAIEEQSADIDCVYAWEISRIGRTKKVLFSILEYLTERKIQLKISEPSISLLNDDKTINEGSETVFTLFAQLAESEMRNKKARFKRGKEGAAKEGKYIGGEITYGYEIDNNGYLSINEKKIKVVKYIFNQFLTGNYSTYSLAKELQELGYINYEKPLSARNFVAKILHNYNYAGISNSIYEYKFIIIAKEDIDTAIRICKNNVMQPKSIVKNIYYCKSLIKTNTCNHTYIGNPIKTVYYCPQCKKSLYIPINTIDSLAWYVAIIYQISASLHASEIDIENYNNQLSVLNKKIVVSNKNIEDKNKSLDILNERIIRGKISESKGELIYTDINKELKIEKKKYRKIYNANK